MEAAAVRTELDDVVADHGPAPRTIIHFGEVVYTIIPGIEGDNELAFIASSRSSRTSPRGRSRSCECPTPDVSRGSWRWSSHDGEPRSSAWPWRDTSLVEARFARRVLARDSLELVQDDIPNLSRKPYGEFDVVLRPGVVYPLDGPEVFDLVAHDCEVCRGLAIMEQHITTVRRRAFTHTGRTYWASRLKEPTALVGDRDRRLLWTSLGNRRGAPAQCGFLLRAC
jgi:hypothetical protein